MRFTAITLFTWAPYLDLNSLDDPKVKRFLITRMYEPNVWMLRDRHVCQVYYSDTWFECIAAIWTVLGNEYITSRMAHGFVRGTGAPHVQ